MYYWDEDYFSGELYHDLRWVIPGKLAAGMTPEYSIHDPEWYHKQGIRAILNVSGIVPLKKEQDFRALGMSYMFNPTQDGEAPDLIKSVKFIGKNNKRNKPVFVHCFGGVGRTGVVLAAYLLHIKMFKDPNEAIRHIRKIYHPGAIETFRQKEAVIKFSQIGWFSKLLIL